MLIPLYSYSDLPLLLTDEHLASLETNNTPNFKYPFHFTNLRI